MKVIDVRIAVPDEALTNSRGETIMSMPDLGEWIAETVCDGLSAEGYFIGGNIFPLTLPKRVTIRESTYRDRPGFTVSAGASSIFTLTRPSAERIRDRLRRGEDTRREDFDLK